MKRLAAGLGALGLTLSPALAWACPVCAGRDINTTMVVTLLGLMIAVPYAIAVVVIRVIRKIDPAAPAPGATQT